MAKKKNTSKGLAQAKRKRRQWLTFVRICRYGVNNLSRNAWLTIAATAVMVITLLVIFTSAVAYNTLNDTVDQIRDRVKMSIYVKSDTSKESLETIKKDLKKLPSVEKVNYISPDQARSIVAQNNKEHTDILDALNEATNSLPGTFDIKIVDINDTAELENFVKKNETLKQNLDPDHDPSFSGGKREAIKRIGSWADFAVSAGLGASLVFVAISTLIVFNTIRMAIFNRKDEIEMMKLIGAGKGFIRGPFIVEAVVYGFIAAVIATGLGLTALYTAKPTLAGYQIAVGPTITTVTTYLWLVLLIMIVIGAVIGTVSSLLATRRYLKM